MAAMVAGKCDTNASGEYTFTIYRLPTYDYFEVNRNDPFNAPGGNNDGH